MVAAPADDELEVLPAPMLKLYRCEVDPLELLPLKILETSTPFTWKVFEVSRWPFAQMGWLPSPALVSSPLSNSAFTPGASTASCVKLPVARGVRAICCLSRVWPFVVSVALRRGFAHTVTDCETCPILSAVFRVAARASWTS